MASGAMNLPRDEAGTGNPFAASADESERIRALIRTELDRRYASPIARRTLELLAEAATEPTDTPPGYRIVDRTGQTRYHQGSEPGSRNGPAPMTLGDLVDELRERYPDLFSKPPEPEPSPVPRESEPDHDTMAEVRAAGARFVEHQTALAKSLATSSAERGRALADRVSGTIGGWRSSRGESPEATSATAPEEPPARADAVSSERIAVPVAPGPRLRDRIRDSVQGLSERWRSGADSRERGGSGRGLILAGSGALLVIALLAAILVLRRDTSPSAAEPQVAESGRTETDKPEPGKGNAQAPASGAQPGAGAKPQGDPTADDPSDEATDPNALKGVPEVVDTATLRVAGKLVRLFGVEWVRGAQGQDLTRYLSGRSVSCLPAPGSTAFTCTVEGRDLSEVVLFNGGGRASSEAAPEHVAAEEHARTERLGVWKR